MGELVAVARKALEQREERERQRRATEGEDADQARWEWLDAEIEPLLAVALRDGLPRPRPRLVLPSGRLVDDANVFIRGSVQRWQHAREKGLSGIAEEEARDLAVGLAWWREGCGGTEGGWDSSASAPSTTGVKGERKNGS
jgi:hypothetical protein